MFLSVAASAEDVLVAGMRRVEGEEEDEEEGEEEERGGG